jgi:signal peptidase I
MVEKISYLFRGPRRGEIVVFETEGLSDGDRGPYWVFRVVGLPGERVRIDPPDLLIDGHKVTEPPILARIAAREDGYEGFHRIENAPRRGCEMEVLLGEDEYFVLGDNTSDAYDSRYWGPVPRAKIVGRVTRIYWPLDRVNTLEGKW